MTFTTTHDLRHLPAVKAGAERLAETQATLETIEEGKASAAERLGNVVAKLLAGDTTTTATQLRNAKDDVERHGYLHAGAARAATAAANGIVNENTDVASAIASRLQGEGYNQFPVNVVIGVDPPTAELVNPMRPMLYVEQSKMGDLSDGGYASGVCMVSFYPQNTLEQAPDKVHLLRMLQASFGQVAGFDVSVDSYSPLQFDGGPAATGYRIVAKYVLPPIPTLRGGPNFDAFLKRLASVALARLMQKEGLHGVAKLGWATVSGPKETDGVTVQTVAVRIEVGAPQSDYRNSLDKSCLEAAHAALKVDGVQAYVGAVTAAKAVGNVPTINLRTTVRTLAAEPGITAEADAVFTLRYHYQDAPVVDMVDMTNGNADDVMTNASGEQVYRWEL